VSPNDLATKGAPLYSVQGTDGQVRTVAAPWDAYVVSVIVTNGQFVQPGTPIATLEEVTGPSDPLEAVVFMPAAAAPTIPLGIGVTVNAPSAPSSIFGTLRGTVASVGNFPETTDSLQAFLGRLPRPSRSAGSMASAATRAPRTLTAVDDLTAYLPRPYVRETHDFR
jgi:HlyD family secretion protein